MINKNTCSTNEPLQVFFCLKGARLSFCTPGCKLPAG